VLWETTEQKRKRKRRNWRKKTSLSLMSPWDCDLLWDSLFVDCFWD